MLRDPWRISSVHLPCFLRAHSPTHPLRAPPDLRRTQEEFERERAAVDAVVARIEEEERAAAAAAASRRVQTQAEIQRFLGQQQELKRK